MKKTQFKDLIRNIRGQLASWLSIMIIAMMAITAFLGVRFSSESLHDDANNIYAETNFRDYELISSMLFDEEDVRQIKQIPSVKDAEGVYVANVVANANNINKNVSAVSLTERINVPHIFSGRLPENDKECAVELDIVNSLKLSIGDSITLEDTGDYLLNNEFTITGIVCHPDNLAGEAQIPGRRYVIIKDDAFNKESMLDCFNKVEITLKDAETDDRYNGAYLEDLNEHISDFDELGDIRTTIRIEQYKKEIAESEEKLSDAKAQLEDARIQIEENRQKLADGKKQLDDAKETLDSTLKKLADGERQLRDGMNTLKEGKEQLDDAKAELDDGKEQLFETYYLGHQLRTFLQNYMKNYLRRIDLSDMLYGLTWIVDFDVDDPDLSVAYLPITTNFSLDVRRFAKRAERYRHLIEIIDKYFVTPEQISKLYIYYYGEDDPTLSRDEKIEKIVKEKLYPEINRLIDQYEDMYDVSLEDLADDVITWDSRHRDYIDGKEEYQGNLDRYNEGLQTYNDAMVTYATSRDQYNRGLRQYNDGLKEYEDSLVLFNEKENEFKEAEAEYNENLDKLNKYKELISKIDGGKWVVFSPLQNGSYLGIDEVSGNFSGMASTFSLLFVFVGALVIYATAGKIIEEQRTLVGTTKALGFFNREVFLKYLGFALSSTLIGIISGIFLSYAIFQKFFVSMALQYFNLGEGVLHFGRLDSILAILAATILCVAAVYFACAKLIGTPVKDLMVPEVPKAKKKSGSKGHGSLYSRLIIRNMFEDPKRILVTIVSIAGCCGLLVIGFTARHSILKAVDLQFNTLTVYDYHVKYNSSINENVEEEIEKVLDRNGIKYINSALITQPFICDNKLTMTILISMDYDEINDYFVMSDPKTHEPLDLKDGVYVSTKQGKNFGTVPGSEVVFLDDKLNEKPGVVVGYYECYASNTMMISDKAYKETFGEDVQHNQYLLKTDEKVLDSIRNELLSIPGVTAITPFDETRSQTENFITIFNYMLILLTIMAAVMAYFIIFNLTSTYISQKKRELTVMRINGFFVKEVVNYVSTELYLTSAVGIVFGWLLGSIMADLIITKVENNAIYYHNIYPMGWLLATIITAIFTVVIIKISLRKVKDLKLTDI